MSGICAIWRSDSAPISIELAAAADKLSPDATGLIEYDIDGCAGIAACRGLGTQQIFRSAGVLIACDAELSNREELFEEVGKPADCARATTAALFAAMYERFGSHFVSKLRGGFAVTIWDRRRNRLLAAVDQFGIKRLVYHDGGRWVAVASRIDALMRFGGIGHDINCRAIANYLNFTVSLAPETIFTRVSRLFPGHLLIAENRNTRALPYWDLEYDPERKPDEARLSEELESVVAQSVAAQCKANPAHRIGAFLSGGTDSSTVVGLMNRAGGSRAKAFSIGFEEQVFDELNYARIAAKAFDAEHHTYLVRPQDCFDALPRIVRHFDEPFGNSSAIPTYFCARLAAGYGVTTLLAGDGGDELFGGNERYLTDKVFEIYQTVPPLLRKRLVEPLLSNIPAKNGFVGKARNYVRRSNIPNPERFFSYHFLCAHSPSDVFTADFLRELAGHSVLDIPSRYYAQCTGRDHLDRLLYIDVKISLGDSDLPKVTAMSELAGIQPRFPFLDPSVAELSGRIPSHLKVKGFEKRYLFKRAFRKLLPIEIIKKKKHGFGIPVSTWLKSDPRLRELSRDTLLSARAMGRGYVRRDFLEGLFLKNETDESSYYGDTLWNFLALELWHERLGETVARTAGRTSQHL